MRNHQIRDLHDRLIPTLVDVDSLVAQIDRPFVATLRRGKTRSEDMWIVLNDINATPLLENGTSPLVDVLNAAHHLTRPLGLGRFVCTLLADVRDKLSLDCRRLHEEAGDFAILSWGES